MGRSFRIFLISYAMAMIACTFSMGKDILDEPGGVWLMSGFAAVSYTALALGYVLTTDRNRAPGRSALAVVFLAALSLVLIAIYPDVVIRESIHLLISVPVYLSGAALLLRRLKPSNDRKETRMWRTTTLCGLFAGAALVFASLPMKITFEHGRGWEVIAFRTQWITSQANVANGISSVPEIPWLQPFYIPGGYVFYSLGLIGTITMLIVLAVSRMRLHRACRSSLFVASLIALNIAYFWIVTDIFWGWHFDLSRFPVSATIATALWLAGPLFAIVLLVPLFWNRNDLWRLRAFLAFQVPIAAFNMAMIGQYWGPGIPDVPALGLLIIGLQLETLACIELLAVRAQTTSVVQEAQQDSVKIHAIAA